MRPRRARRARRSTPTISMARPARTSRSRATPSITHGPRGSRLRRLRLRPRGRAVQSAFAALPAGLRTDAAGSATIPLPLPEIGAGQPPDRSSTATLRAHRRLRPPGRARASPARCLPDAALIGIRPLFDGAVDEGGTARLRGDRPRPATLARTGLASVDWTLSRIDTTYQWYELDGNWNYEPITRRETRRQRHAGPRRRRARPGSSRRCDWGRYELSLTSRRRRATSPPASVSTPAGTRPARRRYTRRARPQPRPRRLCPRRYREASASTPAPTAIALITVVERPADRHGSARGCRQGETIIDLPVTADWGPGAYVTATLFRPMDVAAKRIPARAVGLAWAGVDPGPRRAGRPLRATAETATRARPHGGATGRRASPPEPRPMSPSPRSMSAS